MFGGRRRKQKELQAAIVRVQQRLREAGASQAAVDGFPKFMQDRIVAALQDFPELARRPDGIAAVLEVDVKLYFVKHVPS